MRQFWILFASCCGALTLSAQPVPPADAGSPSAQPPVAQAAPARVRAFEYSDGYLFRRKVHKYASIATAPLFVSQFIVGQKLYNRNGTSTGSLRGAHSALAAGTATLFGINSVTGVWNMWEGRKDPNHRTRRMLHGILMLAADAGFVATAALAPEDESEHGRLATNNTGRRSTHRTVALTSMGVAAFSYVYMLLAR